MNLNLHIKNLRHWKASIGFFVVALCYIFLAARPTHLTSQDLGRHLTNGKMVFSDSAVLSTNFYSYTHADFPFVNHHWGSGLVFYSFQQLFGFAGLSILFLATCLGAIFILFRESLRLGAGTLETLTATLVCVPLIAYRAEVRPEAFSYLFCALFFQILNRWSDHREQKKLFPLPFLMVLWANLHIYFAFGFAILGAFFLQLCLELFRTRSAHARRELIQLSRIILLCGLATFVNPIGYRLALTPLQIFNNYGYRIAENQSVYFLWNFGIVPPAFYSLCFVALLLLCGFFASIVTLPKNSHWPLTIIAALFFALAATAVRNFPLLGLLAIPYLALLFQRIDAWLATLRGRRALRICFFAMVLSISSFAYFQSLTTTSPGIGLAENDAASANFFIEQNLSGPIFNNYDIGSYLIYYLFPREKVFVDNRPEAYPAVFFSRTYIPMQENEARWREELQRFGFNVIYFYWHDLTTWGQSFLIQRTQDPEWVPVYVDSQALILVKNDPKNHDVISKFSIPRNTFQAR